MEERTLQLFGAPKAGKGLGRGRAGCWTRGPALCLAVAGTGPLGTGYGYDGYDQQLYGGLQGDLMISDAGL